MTRRSAPPGGVEGYLAERRERVEGFLREHLPEVAPGSPDEPVVRAMREAVAAGGKRLRPILVLAVAEALRGREARVRGLAAAVEFVHTASLVLDDLPSMDDATTRRGRPALHRAHGEATAILAATALLLLAFEAIARGAREAGLRAEETASLVEAAARAAGVRGMVGGQIADLTRMGPGVDLRTVEFVHRRKTVDLFVLCVRGAALASRASARSLGALDAYARNLGLAFQVSDDLLDATGTSDSLGKNARADRGKTTFVDLCGVEESARLVRELVEAAKSALEPLGARAARLSEIADLVAAREA